MVAMMTIPAFGYYISIQPLYDMHSEPSPPPEEDIAQTIKSHNSQPLEKIVSFIELVCKVAHLGGIHN